MKKVFNWIFKGSIGTFRIAYFLLAVGIILAAAYILGGYQFLVKGALGSDMPFAFSIAAWVDKYFPHVPFWYPLAGGGVSITHSYPVFSFYLTALLRRLTGLELIQAFRILGFSSVPLMALGIYFFVAARLKNQTAALIASIFYLISPIAWTWIFDWGFYAEAVSHIFVMPAIIFWDLFFTSFVDSETNLLRGLPGAFPRPTSSPAVSSKQRGAGARRGSLLLRSPDRRASAGQAGPCHPQEIQTTNGVGIKSRIYLALTVIFLSLATLAHFGTGLGLMGFLGFYIIGYTLRCRNRKQIFTRGLLALLLVGSLTFAATSSVIVPFYRYRKIAIQAGISGGKSLEELKQAELSLGHILGFQPAEQGSFVYSHKNMAFSMIASSFAILGILLAFQNARFLTLALFAIFALTLSIKADFVYWAGRYIPWPLSAAFSDRLALVLLRFIIPALGALGAIEIFKAPFFWVKNRSLKFVRNLVASLVGLALVSFALFQFGNYFSPSEFQYNFGARGLDLEFDLRNIWNAPREVCYPGDPDEECFDYDKDLCLVVDEGFSWRLSEFDGDRDEWCDSPLSGYFDPLAVWDWCVRMRRAAEWTDLPVDIPEVCDIRRLTQEKTEVFWNNCRSREVSKYSLCNLRYKSLEEQLSPAGWPKFEISKVMKGSEGLGGFAQLETALAKISDDNSSARVDFSQEKSKYAMTAPLYTSKTNLSQFRSYATRPLLNRRFWAQQTGVFYLDDPFYGEDEERINELARWFGINYVFLGSGDDRGLFEKAGWESFLGSEVYKFPEENSLGDLSDRPSVLVIGQKKVQAYDHVFRLASFGVLPYEEALPVWGKGKVDEYSLEELRAFDVLVLHGYDYSNRSKADKLLADYVRSGGRVFIDTGWQYTVPDWETEKNAKALEIIPFTRLSWVNPEGAGGFVLEDAELGEGVDTAGIGPLVYEGQPWNVSTGERGDLKEGARVVLSLKKDSPFKDSPLIVAGEFGQGRVVWSGMNIFPHAKQGASIYYEEIKLLANLFSWLLEGNGGRQFDVSYMREHPDAVEFTINEDLPDGGFLLWKEAFHPDFRASLEGPQGVVKLKTHRAGPALTAIQLPQVNKGTEIVHQYHKPWFEKTFSFLSLATYLLLLLIILEAPFLKEKSLFLRLTNFLENKISFLLFGIWKKPTWLEKGEEEDY